jgi:hypothetical protein
MFWVPSLLGRIRFLKPRLGSYMFPGKIARDYITLIKILYCVYLYIYIYAKNNTIFNYI